MPDFYSQQYENAGPLARPVIQRSQYLADALAAMRQDSSHINNGGQLAARLLAQAIGQWAQHRQEGRLARANALDTQNLAAPGQTMLAGMLAGAQGSPQTTPAPAMATPPPPPEQMAAPPPPPPMVNPQAPGANDPQFRAESGGRQFDRNGNVLTSRTGAFGVAQLMPGTADMMAAHLGDPSLAARSRTDPEVNMRLGNAYRDQLLQQFGGNTAAALAAYNAGPQPVQDWINGTNSQYYSNSRHGMAPTNPNGLRLGMPQPGQEAQWAAQIPWPETRNYVRGLLPQMQGGAPQQEQPQQAPAPTPPATGGGAPPAGPMPSTGQAGGSQFAAPAGIWSVTTQEELNHLQTELGSGNRQRIEAATTRLQAIQQAAMAPVRHNYGDMTATGQVIDRSGNGPPTAIDVQGFRRDPSVATYNGQPATYNPSHPEAGMSPIPVAPSMRSQVLSGQAAVNAGFQPGTVAEASPTGGAVVRQAPQAPREPPVTFRPTTPEEERQYGGPGQMDSRGQFHATAQRALTGPLLNLESRDMEAVNTASNVLSLLQTQAQRIDNGQLHLGPLTNALQSGRNMVGQSDQASANFADFNAARDQIRNQSLRLNPGVQTEGDAIRATNELFANTNDQRVVRQRLAAAIQQYRRIQDQRLAQINLRRRQNGLAPYTLQDIEGTAQEAGQGARSQPQGHQAPRSGPRVMTFNPATGRLE